MNKVKIPDDEIIVKHYKRFRQYSQSEDWIKWYTRVAKFKGTRTSQILLEHKKSNAKLLDVGSGLGLTFAYVCQKFENSIACEVDAESAKATCELLEALGLKRKVIKYNGKKLPFPDNAFDIVTSIEVIEHADNAKQMLSEIARVLKPDGILHITTANKWWPYEPHFKLFFLSYLPAKWADRYVRLSGRGKSYENIRLPSYDSFLKMVSQYFVVNDITLEIIKRYKKYKFDKERGRKVVYVGEFLKLLDKFQKLPLLGFLVDLVYWILIRISLGWLFIAKVKK